MKIRKQLTIKFPKNQQLKMFLLKCPKCKSEMKYQNKDIYLSKKKKRCVYCGFQMQVNTSIIKRL